MAIRHEGVSVHRLRPEADNPREVAFAEAWKNRNTHFHRTLVDLVGPEVSQRDATVAATIVQWLGSPVGSCFLCDVINASADVQREIQDRCPGIGKRKV